MDEDIEQVEQFQFVTDAPPLTLQQERDLLDVVAAIGSFQEEVDEHGNGTGRQRFKYGADCVECLRFLIRKVKTEAKENTNNFPYRERLATLNVLEGKLIPLLSEYSHDRTATVQVTKLLVFLTMPLPKATKNAPALQNMMLLAKEAFLVGDVVAAVAGLLEEPLADPSLLQKDADAQNLIGSVLTLFNNLLRVPNPTLGTSASGNFHRTHLHEDFCVALRAEAVVDIVLGLVQLVEAETRVLSWLFLDFFYFLLLGIRPSETLKAFQVMSRPQSKATAAARKVPTEVDLKLREFQAKEAAQAVVARSALSARHSRFVGTVKLTANTGVTKLHHNVFKPAALGPSIPRRKARINVRHPAMPAATWHTTPAHSTESSVTKALAVVYEVVQALLQNGYGLLLHIIKTDIARQHMREGADEDEEHVKLMRFAGFCTHVHILQQLQVTNKQVGQLDVTPIEAALDVWSFTHVFLKCAEWLEAKPPKYAGLATGVFAMKEKLSMLDAMTRYGNEAAKDIAEAIRRKVFMEIERFKVIVTLAHSWRPNTFTLEYMCDLLEVIHVTLKMADDMAANAETVTRRRTRVVRKQLEDGTVQEEEVVELHHEAFDERRLQALFMDTRVVDLIMDVLGQYSKLSAKSCYYLSALLNRIMDTPNLEAGYDHAGAPITYRGMLYHLHMILHLEKLLNDPLFKDAALIASCKRLTTSFFDDAQFNHLWFVEILFRRRKGEEHNMARGYEDRVRHSNAGRTADDNSDFDEDQEWDGEDTGIDPNGAPDDAQETKSSGPKAHRWTAAEDAALAQLFPVYMDTSAPFHFMACEPCMARRTADMIERRCKFLKLSLSASKRSEGATPTSATVLTIVRDGIHSKQLDVDAVTWLACVLLKAYQARLSSQGPATNALAASDTEPDTDEAPVAGNSKHKAKGTALFSVPIIPGAVHNLTFDAAHQRQVLGAPAFQKLLKAVGATPPGGGARWWTIGTAVETNHLLSATGAIRAAVQLHEKGHVAIQLPNIPDAPRPRKPRAPPSASKAHDGEDAQAVPAASKSDDSDDASVASSASEASSKPRTHRAAPAATPARRSSRAASSQQQPRRRSHEERKSTTTTEEPVERPNKEWTGISDSEDDAAMSDETRSPGDAPAARTASPAAGGDSVPVDAGDDEDEDAEDAVVIRRRTSLGAKRSKPKPKPSARVAAPVVSASKSAQRRLVGAALSDSDDDMVVVGDDDDALVPAGATAAAESLDVRG